MRRAADGGAELKTANTLATLPYSTQWIDESDIEAVVEVLRSERLTGGPALERFEGPAAIWPRADPASNYVAKRGKTRGQKGDQVPRARKKHDGD